MKSFYHYLVITNEINEPTDREIRGQSINSASINPGLT